VRREVHAFGCCQAGDRRLSYRYLGKQRWRPAGRPIGTAGPDAGATPTRSARLWLPDGPIAALPAGHTTTITYCSPGGSPLAMDPPSVTRHRSPAFSMRLIRNRFRGAHSSSSSWRLRLGRVVQPAPGWATSRVRLDRLSGARGVRRGVKPNGEVSKKLSAVQVGGTGHYLNSPADLAGSVLDVLRAQTRGIGPVRAASPDAVG